jgi:hypothetical protein
MNIINFPRLEQREPETGIEKYQYLKRPDGKPLNADDIFLLCFCLEKTDQDDLMITTYDYLLENEFPNKHSKRTVSRTLKNIALYMNAEFKKSLRVNGAKDFNKLVITRVDNLDELIEESINKFRRSIKQSNYKTNFLGYR